MRVLTITNMYPRAGREGWGSFVQSQVDSLTRKGVEHDLMVIDGYRSKLAYLLAFFRLWWRCATRRYDVIHAHYGLCGLVARAQIGTPVVVSFCGDDLYGHSDAAGRPTPTSLFWVRLHKIMARTVDAVIVKSAAMGRLLPGIDVEVIPNGVDLDMFVPMPMAECRRKLGLADDRAYILFPYAPDRVRKNFAAVEQAVAKLNAEGGRRHEILLVSGRPNSDMPLFMSAADVLVLASYWEGSPNVVKEAMGCNLPIVSVDVGDVREIMGATDGCQICERTAEDIANKIRSVLSRGRRTDGRRAILHLGIERVADRVLAVYAGVRGRRRRRWIRSSAAS